MDFSRNVALEIERKKAETELAVNMALVKVGYISGEMTYAKAVKTYGKAFLDEAIRRGKLSPCRVSHGNRKYFSVSDILAIKCVEYENTINVLNIR